MGYCIGCFTIKKSEATPRNFLVNLNEFTYDPYECDGYHGKIIFHQNHVYSSEEEAHDAINRFDKDFYADHAVLFRKGRTVYWLVKYECHC